MFCFFRAPLFFYEFDYDGPLNIYKSFSKNSSQYPGAVHGDEIYYLFGQSFCQVEAKDPEKLEEAKDMRDLMCTLWTNFAKGKVVGKISANGVEDWRPVKDQNYELMKINGPRDCKMDVNLQVNARTLFWKQLIRKTRIMCKL